MEMLAVLRYAQAIFDLAVEKNQVDEFNQACKDVHTVILSDSQLLAMVNHLSIPAHEKMETMNAIFSGKVPQDFIGMLDLVFKRGRQGELLGILERFEELYKEHNNVVDAEIFAAAEIPSPKLTEIVEMLGKKLGKTVNHTMHIDPALIAGFRVVVGGYVFDSSLKNQLSLMKKKLESRG